MNRESTGQGGPNTVRFFNLRSVPRLVMAVIFLGAPVTSARADPLTTFTLTDLGPGTPTFAGDANGNGIVIAGNGRTAYAFQNAQDTSLSPQPLLSSHFPLPAQAPIGDPNTYGNPANAYSTLLNSITNGNGVYVAIDASGVYGHEGSSDVYYVKQNPDGSWSSPTGMWSGGVQFEGQANPGQASIIGLNKLNEVLGTGLGPASNGLGLPQTYLYNVNSNSLLNLGTLAVLQAGGWNNIQPIAIDDQGRILLQASLPPGAGSGPEQTLLLTPQGVSSDPLEVPAPEPGALALAVVTIAALTLRRIARNRRQR
jgi:hypothetical protein